MRHGARNYKYLRHSELRCTASGWEMKFINEHLNFEIFFCLSWALIYTNDLSIIFVILVEGEEAAFYSTKLIPF